jgi:hypothetical protein
MNSRDVVLTLALFTVVSIAWLLWPDAPLPCDAVEWQSVLHWRRVKNTTILLARCHVENYDSALNITRRAWRGAVLRTPSISLCFRIASGSRSLIDVFAVHAMRPSSDMDCHPPKNEPTF